MFHNGQTESGPPLLAGPGLIHPVKALEDPRQVLEGDADAGVCHRNPDVFALIFRKQTDRTAIGGVLDGVFQQVDHDLFQSPLVRHHARQSSRRWIH